MYVLIKISLLADNSIDDIEDKRSCMNCGIQSKRKMTMWG